MVSYEVVDWIIWSVVGFVFILLLFLLWFITIIHRQNSSDRLLVIDKNNRWRMHFTKLKGKTEEKIGEGTYILQENCGLLNNKGKVLYVFSEGKSQPLKIDYNKAEWLNSESLMSIINNKLVQQIITPKDSMKDSLMMFGAIGGLIAGLASVVILLLQLGVIGGT